MRKLADGVGLRADRLDLHLGALSGGERRRAELVHILFGGSELLLLDGLPAGQVTSAAWGETVGSCVGLAYLRSDRPVTADSLAAGRFEVDVAGERCAVRCSLKAPLA